MRWASPQVTRPPAPTSPAPGQAITPAGELPSDGAVISAGIFVDTRFNAIDDLRRIAESTCPDLAFPQPAPFFLDVIERGWTKASALPALLDAMGITPEEVAYFGDSENDLTMLEAIPNSYAVANASPEARGAAVNTLGPARRTPWLSSSRTSWPRPAQPGRIQLRPPRTPFRTKRAARRPLFSPPKSVRSGSQAPPLRSPRCPRCADAAGRRGCCPRP